MQLLCLAAAEVDGGGSGSIRIVGRLIREADTFVVLPIVTVDSGSPTMTATLSLTIAVVSKDTPTITKDITVYTIQVMSIQNTKQSIFVSI